MKEVERMTNEQAKRADYLARLDELSRLEESTTDHETLKLIAQRKKAIREALDSI